MENSAPNDRAIWQVVIVSALALFIIFGIRLSFSVFFDEFITAEGWSSAAGSSIFSVSMIVFAVTAPPTGFLLDRFGPRVVFSVGAALLGLGLLLSSRANTIEQLIVAYGVVGGAGLGVIGLGPMAGNITAWVPPAQRGRAIGIAFAGTGLGSLVFVPLSEALISRMGWRDTYLVLSAVCFFVLMPLLFGFLRKPPTLDKPQHDKPTDTPTTGWRVLARDALFWVMLFVGLNALLPLRALTVHQVRYMVSVGVAREVAARYVGLAGLITIGAFVGWGFISDRFGRAWTFTLGAASLVFGVVVLWLLGRSQPVFLLTLYATLYALGEGTRSSQTTALASDTFASGGLGLVNSLMGAMFGLGAAFGPWMMGWLYDRTGSYNGGLWMVAVSVLLSVLGFWAVRLIGRDR
jgi:MFS family permease